MARHCVLLPLAAALVLMALAPVGYVGGGWDDQHYLEAARCAAREGFCLPENHWARRFTLVVPTGLMLSIFGESRQTLWLVPAAYSLAAVALFTLTVQRCYGRATALLSGLLFATMGVFSSRMLDLGVDTAEIAFIMAGALCLRLCAEGRSGMWAAAAGLMLGLAVLTRPTTLALLPLAIAALLFVRQHRQLAPFLAAFAVAVALEGFLYWLWAGDPLLPWRLSLAHTKIPTSELPAGFDLSASPLFNIAFIDAWRPASGIEVHWTADALLNLLAHPTMLVLPIALVLLLLHRRELGRPQAGGTALLLLIGAACLYFGALVYAFAIDPKPRMFLPVAAVACVVIGVLGRLMWDKGGRIVVLCIVGAVALQAGMQALLRVGGDPIGAALHPLPPL